MNAPLPVPANVDPALVVDFDYIHPAGLDQGDVFTAFARLHDGPDIVWTPRYGGHWIATRGEDIQWIQERHDLFSNAEKNVPKGSFPSMPPITENPPNHSRYRAVLNPYFTRNRIEQRHEASARAVIVALIEALQPKKRSEIVAEFTTIAPLRIFWDLVDLPYERRDDFLRWGRNFAVRGEPEKRMAAHRELVEYLGQLLDERIEAPGDDVFTGISQWRNNPRYQHRGELLGMAQLVFLGGLDTVASLMGFSLLRLAERPELQQRLKDDPAIIPAAVDELLRRHGLSNSARMSRQDVTRKGATMVEGDMIMVMNSLSGIDARLYADPFTVNFDRGAVHHNSMGNGPHKCVGQHLARMEMRILLEEWAARMPIVRLDPGAPAPRSWAGAVIGLEHLHLAWD
ncbi:cytochrome P450 [Novosphingobium sp. MMS21-SN21R]|uniref:cytochrome P450 n=1 Tax=Novosphingobium sp. MMS21-SN21R TaxID=2969298 RepID=UPI00288785AA|nr:cytochrome P450 [Novosphingobium sp. MMS21-SN21R]MDT0509915.1 cytochrome P450 [Novosphingobium sp. MMS21-SN21R]